MFVRKEFLSGRNKASKAKRPSILSSRDPRSKERNKPVLVSLQVHHRGRLFRDQRWYNPRTRFSRTTEVNYQEPRSVLRCGFDATAFRYSTSVRESFVAEGNGSLATFTLLSIDTHGRKSYTPCCADRWTDALTRSKAEGNN
jgi:hypothetical protein